MARTYIFSDEAGCFTFERKANVSRYFILCTVIMDDCDIAHELLRARRDLLWEDVELGDYFHATTEKQQVRDTIFGILTQHIFSIQATIMEKSKAQPQVRKSKERFYQYGWYYHFKHGVSRRILRHDEAHITAASIGSKKEKISFLNGINDVMRQTVNGRWKVDFRSSSADPCLQVADYCAWAIQRKWERGDRRSYDLIANKITYEYELWARGKDHFY